MQRKKELSFLNIIFCFLVIFIHISSAPISNLQKGSVAYGVFFVPWRLSAFVVQGFIFLSGVKMFLKNDSIGYIKYCLGKIKGIVIPYILTVILFYAYFLHKEYFSFDIKALLGYIIKGDLVSHFYFVIIIIQFYALKPIWRFIVDKISPQIAIITSAIIMLLCKYCLSGFLYNDRLFTTYLFYWIAGCYVGTCYDKVLCHLSRYKTAYICQFLFVATAEAVISYIGFVGGNIKCMELVHCLYCVSAIIFTFVISIFAARYIMKIKLFKKIDKSSYYIYLIHPLFIFITDEYLKKFTIENIISEFAVRCVIIYSLSIFIPMLYSECKNRIKKTININ